LAVIKISAPNLPSVTLGDSDQILVGDWVMAVGNPFGLDHTVTAGIVSAKGRVIGAGPYDDFIQTDASINPGQLRRARFLILKGEVVGVNTAIVAAGQGIGFAIPINMAKDLIPQLISKGKGHAGLAGSRHSGDHAGAGEIVQSARRKGALISNVFANSPAEKSGLKSGDVVRSFEGKPINESRDLPAMVAREPVNKTVTLTALRDGKEMTFQVLLGEMEKGRGSGRTNHQDLVRRIGPHLPRRDARGGGRLEPRAGEQGRNDRQRRGRQPGRDFGRPTGDVLLSLNGDEDQRGRRLRDGGQEDQAGRDRASLYQAG
jgi:serine protease Do